MAFTGERDTGFVDKLVNIGRVAKVVKGGRRFSFSAIVVVGDESGRVGWGSGKAREVPDAVRKATDSAKKSMVRVSMREGRTIHHEVKGRFGASRVILKPATPGTGIIAGGPMRAIFEAMGMKDVVAKSQGSNNPYNMIQATFDAFANLETPRSVAAKRGLKMGDLRARRAAAGFVSAEGDDEQRAAAPAKKIVGKPAAPKKEAGRGPRGAAGGRKPRPAKAAAPESAAEVAAPAAETTSGEES